MSDIPSQRSQAAKAWFGRNWWKAGLLIVVLVLVWAKWPTVKSTVNGLFTSKPEITTVDSTSADLAKAERDRLIKVGIDAANADRAKKDALQRAAQALPLPAGRVIYAKVYETLNDGTKREEFRKVPATGDKQ